jgi:hypothetical protein
VVALVNVVTLLDSFPSANLDKKKKLPQIVIP